MRDADAKFGVKEKIVCITKSVKCTRSRVPIAGRKPRFPSSPMAAGLSTAASASKSTNQKDTSELRFTLVPVNSYSQLSFFLFFLLVCIRYISSRAVRRSRI